MVYRVAGAIVCHGLYSQTSYALLGTEVRMQNTKMITGSHENVLSNNCENGLEKSSNRATLKYSRYRTTKRLRIVIVAGADSQPQLKQQPAPHTAYANILHVGSRKSQMHELEKCVNKKDEMTRGSALR